MTTSDGNVVRHGKECHGETYAFDRTTKVLHAEACNDGFKVPASDRTLAAADASALETLLSTLTTTTEGSCPTDVGTIAVTVTSPSGKHEFVNQENGCNAGGKGILKDDALLQIISKMKELGAVGQAPWFAGAKSITIDTADGNSPHPNGTECHGESFTYDAESNLFHAQRCDGGKKEAPVSTTLADAEATEVGTLLRALQLSTKPTCVLDASVLKATIAGPAASRSFIDDIDVCNGTAAEPIQRASIEALVAKLRAISEPKATPVWTAHSKSLRVSASYGNAPRPNGNECFGETYSFDAATKAFHADPCDGGKKLPAVDKTLSPADATALLDLASTLRTSTAPPACWADVSTYEMSVTDDQGTKADYVDDRSSSCSTTTKTHIDVQALVKIADELHALAR